MYVTPEYIRLDSEFLQNLDRNVGKCQNVARAKLQSKLVVSL